MNNNFCFHFDSNYLPYGMTLIDSINKHIVNSKIFVATLDQYSYDFLVSQKISNVEIIKGQKIENKFSELIDLKSSRTKVEYFFTLTPAICKYIIEEFPDIKRLNYLDSDLYFFSNPQLLFNEIGDSSIAIIEHRFGFTSRHNIKYGRFNVGWISFLNDKQGTECLNNWFDDCIEWCYQVLEPDRYADQKYLNKWPSTYKGLKIIQNKGANLAPWNISNYKIKKIDKKLIVDEDELLFFHFANLKQIDRYKFKTNLSRLLISTSGTIKNEIYMPYLRNLSDNIEKTGIRLNHKKNIRNKSFFINILVEISRYIRDFLYYDIIELK